MGTQGSRKIPCPNGCGRQCQLDGWEESKFDSVSCRKCVLAWNLRLCPNPDCSSNSYPKQIHFNPVDQAGRQSLCQGCNQWFGWNDWRELGQSDEYLLGDLSKSKNLETPAQGLVNQEVQGKTLGRVGLKRLRTSVLALGIVVAVLVPLAGLASWFKWGGNFFFLSSLPTEQNAFVGSLEKRSGGSFQVWPFDIAPGFLLLGLALVAVAALVIAIVSRRFVVKCSIGITLVGILSLAVVLGFSDFWQNAVSKPAFAYERWITFGTGFWLSIAACALEVVFGACLFVLARNDSDVVFASTPVAPVGPLENRETAEPAEVVGGDVTVFKARDFRPNGEVSQDENDGSRLNAAGAEFQSRQFGLGGALINAALFAGLAIVGLLPFLSFKVLGQSMSLNAYEGSGAQDENGNRGWLTIVSVGWIVLAIAAGGLCVTAVAALRSTRSLKQRENHLLASFGLIVGVLIATSWFYINNQIEGSKGVAQAEAISEGNPFAALAGLLADSALSVGPAVGLWLMLVLSLGIIATNFYLSSELGRFPRLFQTAPSPGLATGIRELSELRSQGVISEEEFTLAKRKLIGGDPEA
jgi:hypothetical protein